MRMIPVWTTSYFEEVPILDTVLSVFVDGSKQKIHIVDLHKPGTRRLSQAIRVEYLAHLVRMINTPDQFTLYDLYLYHPGGRIEEYNVYTEEAERVSHSDPHLYQPFTKKIMEI